MESMMFGYNKLERGIIFVTVYIYNISKQRNVLWMVLNSIFSKYYILNIISHNKCNVSF